MLSVAFVAFEYTVCDSSDLCSTAEVNVLVGDVMLDSNGNEQQLNTLLVETNELTHLKVLDYPVDLSGDLQVKEIVNKPQHATVAILSGKKEIFYSPNHDYEGPDCKFVSLMLK
jgi:hypothetical protein